MHVQALPQEIVLHILRDVGPAHFQDNVNQLLICKSWYPAAQSVMVEELSLSEKNLPHFLERMLAQKYLWRLVETNCRKVNLKIRGPQGKSIFKNHSPEFEWGVRMNPCLTYLATRLPRFMRLEDLTIEATAPDPKPHGFQPYLRRRQIANFLSPRYSSRLRSLNLDLCHTLKRETVSNGCGNHLCAFVSKFLLTLRHVRIRMDSVCAEAMEIGDDGKIANLETLIFNMHIPDSDAKPGFPVDARALPCEFKEESRPKCPLQRMMRAAKRLSEKNATIQTARIVTSFYPEKRPVAIDCINGIKTILKDRNDWAGNGPLFNGHVCEEADTD
jgi:hypothetical protein